MTETCDPPLGYFYSAFTVDEITLNETFFGNYTTKSSSLLTFAPFTMNVGLYAIYLTTYYMSPEVYQSDYLYLRYSLPELIPSIKINSFVNSMATVLRSDEVILDASYSTDPAEPSGVPLSMGVAWTCKTGSAITKLEVLDMFLVGAFSTSASVECDDLLIPGQLIC